MRFTLFLLVGLAACGSKNDGAGGDAGAGDASAGDGGGGGDGPPQSCGALTAILRDFKTDHPDMEETVATDRGLVEVDLGSDNKPVFAHAGATTTVSGPASFDQWYRDVAGTNQTFSQDLPLTENPPGTFTFENNAFFPLDNQGFGNEGNAHNFHFTTEIHSTFKYNGGEIFEFTGDDDVFVFVNKKLGIDLGGVHGVQNALLDFDAQASALGIVVGGVYQLDVFHAERHLTESNFKMVTTIECFILE